MVDDDRARKNGQSNSNNDNKRNKSNYSNCNNNGDINGYNNDIDIAVNYCSSNGLEDFSYYVNQLCYTSSNRNQARKNEEDVVIQKFDTGASSCMSSIEGRIVSASTLNPDVKIFGFNNSMSRPSEVGLNRDNKKEYLVPHMPKDLVLLCGHAYASDGAAILTKDGGLIIQLDDHELHDFLLFVKQFPVLKTLKVRNNTNEIDTDNGMNMIDDDANNFLDGDDLMENYSHDHLSLLSSVMNATCDEFADFSNVSTKHFNTKVHLSNQSEVVFMLLMMGLSLNDWYKPVKNGSLGGMPPSVTTKLLSNFVHQHGKIPDIIRLAIPNIPGNRSVLMDPPVELTHCGQRIEVDECESDYNEIEKQAEDSRVRKLPTHGGAIAAAIAVDCYSGFGILNLLKTRGQSVKTIDALVLEFRNNNIDVELIAADQGVLSQSKFQVMKPAAMQRCNELGIQVEVAEPYNHSRGTATVERTIRTVKELCRMAMLFIFRNPNFHTLGFTKTEILKLWGEVFKWAMVISNLKPSQRDPTKSKYELFYGKKPNMQNIRLLPIFSIVFIPRDAEKLSHSSHIRRVIALYVGPAMQTPSAIRAVYKSGGRVEITRTSRITTTTDGGGLNIHGHVERGTANLINNKNGNNDNSNDANDFDVTDDIEQRVPFASIPRRHLSSAARNVTSPAQVQVEQQSSRGVQRDEHRRSQRIKLLEEKRNELMNSAEEVHECAHFADWCTYEETTNYFSYVDNKFIEITSEEPKSEHIMIEQSCRAVTEDIPKSFAAALEHPVWGDAARKEFNTLLTTKAIVETSAEYARSQINQGEADLLVLFPVYEAKMRDGELVYKVRLVGNGKTHYSAINTYAATPSREELLILLHIIAVFSWEYCHIDESRAFLSAEYNGEKDVFTKLQGKDTSYFQVKGALYGLKTSPKDYQEKVAARFEKLGYKRLIMCSCIYILSTDEHIVIVYAFVDDFIFTGDATAETARRIAEFRSETTTTEPDWNAPTLLGIEVERVRSHHAICCTFTKKIEEVVARFEALLPGPKRVPILMSQFIVRVEDLDDLPENKAAFLTAKEVSMYMALVGSLIWISGIRMDILFAVMYLSWSTRNPRQHHLHMALHVLSYLNTTKFLPLVFGGDTGELEILAQTDASLGTAPKGRSVTGHLLALGSKSAPVTAKCNSTATVMTSSFEAELDGTTTGIKAISRIKNALIELRQLLRAIPRLCSDIKALVSWLLGNGVVRSVRHMELRQYYIREKIKRGDCVPYWGPGNKLIADGLTKLKDRTQHSTFAYQLMGHALLFGYHHRGIKELEDKEAADSQQVADIDA